MRTTNIVSRSTNYLTVFGVIKRLVYLFTLILLIITVTSIIIAAFYCVPMSDDYTNGSLTYHALRDSGVLAALKVSFTEAVKFYFQWQGAYFTDFLMKSVPGFIGYDYYWISPIIILFSIVFSVFYAFDYFFRKCFLIEFKEYSFLPMCFLILFLNYMPSIVEGIYWNCGAMYYSLMISIEVCFAVCLTKLYREKNQKCRVVICCVLALAVAGGNLVIALNAAIVLTTVTVFMMVKKVRVRKQFLIINLLLLGGFLISILSPGNQIRASGIENNMSAIRAILLSFPYSIKFIVEHLNWIIVGSVIITSFVLKGIVKKIDFIFPFPLLIITFSYCIFATCFTPTLYALGGEMSGRVMDAAFYMMLLFIFGMEFYIIGYFTKKKSSSQLPKNIFYFSIIILFGIVCITKNGTTVSWTREIFKELKAGSLQTYKKEHDERILLYKSVDKDIEVEALSVYPATVFGSDITDDPQYWINVCVEQFFLKDSVRIK